MSSTGQNKHQRNSARTRDKLLAAAEELYGSRSIDAVSLREITARAGQKNPNALQYHFKDRDGLLQAIIDRHSARVAEYREAYFQRAAQGEWQGAEAAARCLVMPIIEYVQHSPEAVNFVRIVSQVRALNLASDSGRDHGLRFPAVPGLKTLFDSALAELPPREAQRRVYLVVNTTFHGIADIYRQPKDGLNPVLNARGPMAEQLVGLVQAGLAAPSRESRP